MVAHDVRDFERGPVGFLALASHDWNDQWLGRQQVMSRLAKRFHVVWSGPAHEWRESAARVRAGPSVRNPVLELPMLHAYYPEARLPHLYRPAALAKFTLQKRLERARSILVENGCVRIVLSIWSPRYAEVLPLVEHDMSTYHINDEYSFSPVEQPISEEELALMAGVDEVFIHSPAVMARKARYCSSATLTPNGVDFEAFATAQPIPDDLASIPGPRIGYCGFLKMQLNWELLFDVASRNPEYSFVFAGQERDQPGLADALARMRTLPNVHFLGEKSSVQLSAYPQHFDVCVLPYRINDYTKYIDPLKLGEYMASGRPSVGSPIAPLREVKQLMALAESSEEWGRAIAAALRPDANAPEKRKERQDWARTRTWDALVDTILAKVELHLGPI